MDRECPDCGRDTVVSRKEARLVYNNDSRVNERFDDDDVSHSCSYPSCVNGWSPHE